MASGRSYSDSIHQDKRRMWLGNGMTAITRTEAAEDLDLVGRISFPGPVKLLKYGLKVRKVLTDEWECTLMRNSSEIAMVIASTTAAAGAISSTVLDTQYAVAGGSYLTIISSTSAGGSTGSIALFIDYVPLFTGADTWAV